MTVSETITKAEAVVIQAETDHLNALRRKADRARGRGEFDKCDDTISEIVREGQRINKKPIEEYDEEEVIIARLIKKK